ncbi:DNA recombination protein RmuC [Geoglobus acetivorans]|uniref:DNA recombination protein RmuC n=1 Tax=Geoglobus acetivorans TaxID=565033 RepID=A0ABZ3H076_GEOAI|nr:DNA recombination protein RmuC [Geoglobus acetivorans]
MQVAEFYDILLPITVLAVLGYVILKQRNAESRIEEVSRKFEDLNRSLPEWVEGAVAKTFQNSAGVFESLFASAITKNSEVIKGAFATSLKELGIQEDLGKLSEASADLKAITSDLKTMFQVKHARAKFGELQLESLLKDIFPASRIQFQKNIGVGIPDACILVEDGRYLCIDSKFPLENFRKYSEANSESEKEKYWRDFIKDVKNHIEEIRKKYVGKESTLDFAFMFVPSDAIFHHLVSESPDIAVEASKAGVILTSPSVLPAYLSLISARIKAEEISKRADEIQNKINVLGSYINDVDSRFETLSRHVSNAYSNLSKVQQSIASLKGYYSTIAKLEEVEE